MRTLETEGCARDRDPSEQYSLPYGRTGCLVVSGCHAPYVLPVSGGTNPYQPWKYAAKKMKEAAIKAGLGEGIGWHTFRHSYSSMLRDLRVDVKVQQELLRHADIRTTLNVYKQGVAANLRTANDLVVSEVLTGSIQ